LLRAIIPSLRDLLVVGKTVAYGIFVFNCALRRHLFTFQRQTGTWTWHRGNRS